jgi:putative transposase
LAVNWAIKDKSYSQRRACALVGLQPKTYRYASRRSDDAPIRHRLLELAQQRRRFGYGRLHLLLRREGVVLNHKKLYRLYREERLMVRRRGGRKRAIGTRAPMALPQGPNQRWSLDFVSDALACSRKFRVLAVVDDFTRECLALIVDNSLSGIRVARELDCLVERRGRPCLVVSDNGTELTSRAILGWPGPWHRMALHRARQADPEQLHRVVQRQAARRMPPHGHTRAWRAHTNGVCSTSQPGA